MKKRTNCPNCGAPIEIDRIICPFCGTRYLDVESLGLYRPTYLRLNLGDQFGNRSVLMYVSLRNVTFTQTPYASKIDRITLPCGADMELNLEFDVLRDKDGVMMRYREEDGQ